MGEREAAHIDLEHRMAQAELECGNSERVQCAYVRGHAGPCWSGAWDRWGGLSQRCNAGGARENETCIRAKDHRGPHEGQDGATWRRR